jgi:hypothetical protein
MGLVSASRTSLDVVEKREFLSLSGIESRFHGISVRVFITNKYAKSVFQTSLNWYFCRDEVMVVVVVLVLVMVVMLDA